MAEFQPAWDYCKLPNSSPRCLMSELSVPLVLKLVQFCSPQVFGSAQRHVLVTLGRWYCMEGTEATPIVNVWLNRLCSSQVWWCTVGRPKQENCKFELSEFKPRLNDTVRPLGGEFGSPCLLSSLLSLNSSLVWPLLLRIISFLNFSENKQLSSCISDHWWLCRITQTST